MDPKSIYELLRQVARDHADKPAYRFKRDGRWQDLSWTETFAEIRRVAKGLAALGVQPGDRVGILAATCLEWVLCDLGIVSGGAVTVGIYPSNLGADCAYILEHAGIEVLFVENREQLDKVLAVRANVPHVRHLVLYPEAEAGDLAAAEDPGGQILTWEAFLAGGDRIADEEFTRRGEACVPETLASLVYTSGTTGVPKGVMLSHGNLLSTSASVGQRLHLEPHFITLMFLPLAHVFARLMSYCTVRGGVTTAIAENMANLPQNFREIRPHFIISVPRVYEKIQEKILSSADEAGGSRKKLFDWAVGVGQEVRRMREQKRPASLLLRLEHAAADLLVLRKVQAAFGGRLVWAISGGAPLDKSIAEFFIACGVEVLEGIGQTENTSFSNVNLYGDNRPGTVGPVGPGIEMKLAEDGEVLYRGPNVMLGYYRDPEATAETIDRDGWLHTGDIGEIDGDGILRITDRKKDLIITSGGKNVAPQKIERALTSSRFISQAVVYGDRRKYLTALVSLDPDNATRWAKAHGIRSGRFEDLVSDSRVKELIRGEIDIANRELASFETVKRFHILSRDLSIEEGDLTPTLKVKRRVVVDKFRDELEALYDD